MHQSLVHAAAVDPDLQIYLKLDSRDALVVKYHRSYFQNFIQKKTLDSLVAKIVKRHDATEDDNIKKAFVHFFVSC